jgi:DNA polymerase II large subunit
MRQLLLGLFLICTLSAFTQQKKDTKVSVVASDTSNLFNRVALAFYQKGYTLETKDETVGFMHTKEKEMEKYTPYQTISTFVVNGVITMTSKIRMGNLGTFDVEFYNRKKQAFTAAWEEMESIAKQFGDKLTYSK